MCVNQCEPCLVCFYHTAAERPRIFFFATTRRAGRNPRHEFFTSFEQPADSSSRSMPPLETSESPCRGFDVSNATNLTDPCQDRNTRLPRRDNLSVVYFLPTRQSAITAESVDAPTAVGTTKPAPTNTTAPDSNNARPSHPYRRVRQPQRPGCSCILSRSATATATPSRSAHWLPVAVPAPAEKNCWIHIYRPFPPL